VETRSDFDGGDAIARPDDLGYGRGGWGLRVPGRLTLGLEFLRRGLT
jgi:hypothetical protein